MHSMMRLTLGIAAVVCVGVAPSAAAGQASDLTACSLVDAAEIMRATGRKDILGEGPEAYGPPVNGRTECGFLSLHFTLRSNTTPEGFRGMRNAQVKAGKKAEPLTGLGDEAYYVTDTKGGYVQGVAIFYRAGTRQVSIMDMVPPDSVEAAKPMLLSVARLTLSKLRR